MLILCRAATKEYEAAPMESNREAYYAGFLHCWGLATELERERPDTIVLVQSMRELGFPDPVIDAMTNYLESPAGESV